MDQGLIGVIVWRPVKKNLRNLIIDDAVMKT